MVSEARIAAILMTTRTIAVVGASNNPERASYAVLRDLVAHGYDVFAVNPGLAGGHISGVPVFATLKDIPQTIDMVDIFRNSAAAGDVVLEALGLDVPPKTIWMQLGVINEEAAELARGKGLEVVMDRCPKIELSKFSDKSGRK